MSERKSEYDHYLETCTEVWFQGGNPDAVSYDRCQDFYYDGLDSFDSADIEMQHQRSRASEIRRRQQMEQELYLYEAEMRAVREEQND